SGRSRGRLRSAAIVRSRSGEPATPFQDAGRAAARLLGDSLWRALHLGRDSGHADDPGPHAARADLGSSQLTLISPPIGGPAFGRSAGRFAMMQSIERSVVDPPPKNPLMALR